VHDRLDEPARKTEGNTQETKAQENRAQEIRAQEIKRDALREAADMPLPRRPAESVSWGLRVAAEWSGRALIVVVAIYVLFVMLNRVRLVAFAFVVALLLTALLRPLVTVLRRLGVQRSLATLLVLLFGVGVLSLIGWFVTVQVTANASTLSAQVGGAGDKIRSWLVSGPLHLNEAQLAGLVGKLRDAVSRNQGALVSGAFATATTALEAVSGILLALFSTFFLLRDGELVWAWVVRLFPATARIHANVAGGLGWRTLSGYVRGIVIVALTDAISVSVVLLVLRVPLAVPLGVLVFLGAFIPLIGLTVAGTISVLVALISHGLGAALIVLLAIVLLVQAEGHLLHPLVMSRAVRIHPLAVVLAVSAGTLVAGVEGAVIAVPLAAVISNIGGYLRAVPPAREPAG
jgi:predicted PurR-regulated permease PerM